MGAVENLADEIVSAISHSPTLRARLRAMLDEDRAPVHAANDDALRTASIDDYAAAVQVGRRAVEGWIKRGLPTIALRAQRRRDGASLGAGTEGVVTTDPLTFLRARIAGKRAILADLGTGPAADRWRDVLGIEIAELESVVIEMQRSDEP